jgi:hypothetical protein
MLFNVNCWKKQSEKEQTVPGESKLSGVYGSYSDDGIVWQEPERLIADNATARIGRSVTWHPSIVWDRGSTSRGWLLYGHSPRWGHRWDKSGIPHYLVGRRIAFRRDDH